MGMSSPDMKQIETREYGEEFVQDVGGLLIGKLAPQLGLKIPQFRRRGMRGKITAMGDKAAERPQTQASKQGA